MSRQIRGTLMSRLHQRLSEDLQDREFAEAFYDMSVDIALLFLTDLMLFSSRRNTSLRRFSVADRGKPAADDHRGTVCSRAERPEEEGGENDKDAEASEGNLDHEADEGEEQAKGGDKRPDAGCLVDKLSTAGKGWHCRDRNRRG